MISLKNKLPSVEMVATSQHMKRMVQCALDVLSECVMYTVLQNRWDGITSKTDGCVIFVLGSGKSFGNTQGA